MKDKDFKKHKRRVELSAKKWLSVLGLKWWDIEIVYVDNIGNSQHDGRLEIAMICTAMWQYMTAEIDVAVAVVAEMTDDEIDRAFLHECMHILVSEMRERKDRENHEERVCQLLVKAFKWVEEVR